MCAETVKTQFESIQLLLAYFFFAVFVYLLNTMNIFNKL